MKGGVPGNDGNIALSPGPLSIRFLRATLKAGRPRESLGTRLMETDFVYEGNFRDQPHANG